MTKEEIQAQISILYSLCSDENIKYINDTCVINSIIQKLQEQLLSAKSIRDIKKEAFEAARLGLETTIDYFHSYGAKYNTSEDYLKSKTGGNM